MDGGTASSSTGDSSVTLSPRGTGDAAGLIPRVPDSHPISFDAHVTFEARETIFALKTEKRKITQGVEMRGEKKRELKFLKPHLSIREDKLRSTRTSPSPWSAQGNGNPPQTPKVSPDVPCTPPWLQGSTTNSSRTLAALGINY